MSSIQPHGEVSLFHPPCEVLQQPITLFKSTSYFQGREISAARVEGLGRWYLNAETQTRERGAVTIQSNEKTRINKIVKDSWDDSTGICIACIADTRMCDAVSGVMTAAAVNYGLMRGMYSEPWLHCSLRVTHSWFHSLYRHFTLVQLRTFQN